MLAHSRCARRYSSPSASSCARRRAPDLFTFEDVLTQIGLGYVFLFLLAWTARVQGSRRRRSSSPTGLPSRSTRCRPGFERQPSVFRADWPHHVTGFAAHWDKNTNLAHASIMVSEPVSSRASVRLQRRRLPDAELRSVAGDDDLRSAGGRRPPEHPRRDAEKVRVLLAGAWAGIVAGLALHVLGICPIVKRIWTPSWTLFSAGWVALFLAGYYYIIDLKGDRSWTYPFVVVGANSIATYVLVHVATDYVTRSLLIHVGRGPFSVFGDVFAPVLLGACTLALFWLILLWMYRNRCSYAFNLSRGASPLGTPLHALSHAVFTSPRSGVLRSRGSLARARSHLGMSVGSI